MPRGRASQQSEYVWVLISKYHVSEWPKKLHLLKSIDILCISMYFYVIVIDVIVLIVLQCISMSCLWFQSQVQAIQSPSDAVLHPVFVAAPSHFLLTGHVEITQPWLQRLLGMCGMQLSRLKVEDYCYVSLCGDVWCMKIINMCFILFLYLHISQKYLACGSVLSEAQESLTLTGLTEAMGAGNSGDLPVQPGIGH